MKQIHLLSLALLLNFNSFSQDDLIGTWYLHHLNIDNTQIDLPNNQPPYYDDYNFLSLEFYDTDNTGNNINDFYAFGPCDHVSGDYTFTGNTINLYNNVQSLGGCLGAGGTVPSFASNFYTIWQNNLTYSILGNNNETLVITNSLGDQVVYGRNSLSIYDFEAINELTIYPNLVKNILNVDLTNFHNEVTYTIHNSAGKAILNNLDLKDSSINLDFLDSGLYFLKLEAGNQRKHLKFIKQ